MNYQLHYDLLIVRAMKRKIFRGYREKHHIIPRCMGGGNEKENLVKLTAEEHFVAHQLLVKIYPDEPKLVCAVIFMSYQCGNNKVYGWIKRAMSKARKGKKLSPEHRENIASGIRGMVCSPETRDKIAASLTGVKHSPERCAKVSAGLRGRVFHPFTPEQCARVSAGKRGKSFTSAHRAALCVASQRRWANGGIPLTVEHCKKISDAQKGKPRKPHTQETKDKISLGNKGKIISEETRAKTSKTLMGHTHSEETCLKISSSLRHWYESRGCL